MKRLVCWWVGHDWDVYLVNVRKHSILVHLHPLAGCKAYCRRCGKDWDDLWSPYFKNDGTLRLFGDVVISQPRRGYVPLPQAQVRGK